MMTMKYTICGASLLMALATVACGGSDDDKNTGGDGDMMSGDGDGDGDMMSGDGDGDGDGDMMSGDGDGGSELLGPDNPPTLGAQIDRAGRPAISTALIQTFNGDETTKNDAKDDYNAASPSSASAFAETMKTSLAILDSLDGTCGTQLLAGEGDARYDALTDVLLDDQLYVNSGSGTCGVYLGAEGEFVGALEPGEGGCGGRTPLDDVIERSYSVLAAGALTGIDDGIASDGSDHDPDAFPFLAGPN